MRLLVQRENGEEATIDLVLPLMRVSEGERLNSITDVSGTDYYFTADGYYDGWGRAVSAPLTRSLSDVVAAVGPSTD